MQTNKVAPRLLVLGLYFFDPSKLNLSFLQQAQIDTMKKGLLMLLSK